MQTEEGEREERGGGKLNGEKERKLTREKGKTDKKEERENESEKIIFSPHFFKEKEKKKKI